MANPLRILIVDDDTFLIDMYSIKFRQAGHEVETATSGEDVIKRLTEDKKVYDVVLLDLVMPGMDGFEVLHQIRDKGLLPEAKLIILSNQSRPNDIEKAKQYKVSGYIIKASATPTEVLTEVESIAGVSSKQT